MEVFELVVLLLACVIISAILDQVITRVSLPLIQIAIGLLSVLLVPHLTSVNIDPELFLVLFIAPLLFNEAREVGKTRLWENKGGILSLAVGLVLAIVLAVGFSLHWLVPSIPLAAAFACGAALGPTDAAAVGALGSIVRLKERQKTLLSGEALINDASGVVSFQFAIAAITTGVFSATGAGQSFIVLFFGGIAAGIVMGYLARLGIRIVHQRGFVNTTVHTVYEVFTPFVVFIAAEALGVSGILAVVAAGLVMAQPTTHLLSTTDAKHRLVSNSFWEIIVFLINGVVFVLLGMQLPRAFSPDVSDYFSFGQLFGLVIFLTALVVGVRFVWIAIQELIHVDAETGTRGWAQRATTLKDALVTTIAGPKGAVTLSIIFTLPYVLADGTPFVYRTPLIFITAGVILLTLLLADIFLPILAPNKVDQSAFENDLRLASITVLERTIDELRSKIREGTHPEYEPATRLAIARYRTRLNRERMNLEGEGEVVRQLIDEVLDVQQAHADEIRKEGKETYSASDIAPYFAALRNIRSQIGYHGRAAKVGTRFSSLRGRLAMWWQKIFPTQVSKEHNERIYYDSCLLAIDLENVAIDYLDGIAADQTEGQETRVKVARMLAKEHRSARASVMGRINYGQERKMDVPREFDYRIRTHMPEGMRQTFGTQYAQARAYADEVDAGALAIELDEIRHLQEAGQIDDAIARKLREDVYLLQMSLGG